MAFQHGKEARLFLNELHVSGNIKGWSCGGGRELADVTVLTAVGYSWLPGLKYGRMGVNGLFDNAAATLHTEATAAHGTDNGALWTAFPNGWAIGSPAFVCASDLESYEISSTTTEAVSIDVQSQPDDGVEWGVSLHAHEAETTDNDETSVDNAASSTNGGVGVLHVTAYSGLTSAALKVQHSTDNSSWSDLITFTSVTALTAERKTVTGTVNRYLRCSTDVTGTGTLTFVMSFARR